MTTSKRNLERGEVKGGGISLLGGTFLVLLFLKLAQLGVVADWSWWAVFAPIWIPAALVCFLLVVGFIVAGIGLLFESKAARNRRKARAALLALRGPR